MTAPVLAALLGALTPQPQQLTIHSGWLALSGEVRDLQVPAGADYDGCAEVLAEALRAAGVSVQAGRDAEAASFSLGAGAPLEPLPEGDLAQQGYVLAVSPRGISARGGSPAGLLYAAQTLAQLLRLYAEAGGVPCLSIVDYPHLELRGIYIEGGQERFGRIVEADYLCEQIRRLAGFKMNALCIECYNLFPFASFPDCADEGTLSPDECRRINAEADKYHVILIPSLQTLAQAWELFWTSEAGVPYREATAPGLVCPSNPAVYPVIEGLYRDLLTWFEKAPLIGVGCSEIEMRWQERYCPACRARIEGGETVRDLLLCHAQRLTELVRGLAAELGRQVRPMMWADEFYMYGEGRNWLGLDRIDKDTIMGFWKYWRDYEGLEGLMARGYDVLGISAMYNHCFYLADLSPTDPPKSWPAMEQTGTLNITEMVARAARSQLDHPDRRFLGVATASFSKHRLRAFDSIWYGFALNGHCTWSHPQRAPEDTQAAFTSAFARHFYDARTQEAAATLAECMVELDAAKSLLEANNQVLHDVVGVVDTQEAGYLGNTLWGAQHRCCELVAQRSAELGPVRRRAQEATAVGERAAGELDGLRGRVGDFGALGDLWLAAEKIAAHAQRELLLLDTADVLLLREAGGAEDMARRWASHLERLERVRRRSRHLWRSGDPTGILALRRDAAAIHSHLERLSRGGGGEPEPGTFLLEDDFTHLRDKLWVLLGAPRVAGGRLSTEAPGGWERYCGLVSTQEFALEPERPLRVEFDLTPLAMGVDSQLFGAAENGALSYRFTFYGPRDRFGVYTRLSEPPRGLWAESPPGWHLRASSPPVELGRTYRVRAQITQKTFRIIVCPGQTGRWELPFWDSGAIPMDRLDSAQLLFADVEPEGSAGASEWGRLRVWR